MVTPINSESESQSSSPWQVSLKPTGKGADIRQGLSLAGPITHVPKRKESHIHPEASTLQLKATETQAFVDLDVSQLQNLPELRSSRSKSPIVLPKNISRSGIRSLSPIKTTKAKDSRGRSPLKPSRGVPATVSRDEKEAPQKHVSESHPTENCLSCQDLRKQLEILEKENLNWHFKSQRLRNDLQEATIKNESLHKDIEQAHATNCNLQAQVESLESRLEQQTATQDATNHEIDQLKIVISTLATERGEIQCESTKRQQTNDANISELKHQLTRKDADMYELTKQVEYQKNLCNMLQQKRERLDVELQHAKAENAQLQKSLEAATFDRDEAKKVHIKEIQLLQQQLSEHQSAEKLQASKELQEVKQQLDESKVSLETLTAEKEAVMQQLSETMESCKLAMQSTEEMKMCMKEDEKRLQSLRSNVSKLESERDLLAQVQIAEAGSKSDVLPRVSLSLTEDEKTPQARGNSFDPDAVAKSMYMPETLEDSLAYIDPDWNRKADRRRSSMRLLEEIEHDLRMLLQKSEEVLPPFRRSAVSASSGGSRKESILVQKVIDEIHELN